MSKRKDKSDALKNLVAAALSSCRMHGSAVHPENMLWRSKKNIGPVVSGSTGLSLGGAGQPERSPAEAETPANQDIAAPSSASGVAVDLSSPASTLKSFVIPRGYRVSGVIISHRPVVLRGELHGRSVSAGAVTVEATGVLRAPAEVESLRVFGSVVAPVRATLAVEVMSGGSIQDDLETPCLHVAAGGRVSGGLLTVGAAR